MTTVPGQTRAKTHNPRAVVRPEGSNPSLTAPSYFRSSVGRAGLFSPYTARFTKEGRA